MIIYKITNLINGKCYIGQTTKSLEQRFKEHCSNHSNCRAIKSALRKYGAENFKIETIVECSSIEELNEKEEYYIQFFNSLVPNGYNLTKGGLNHEFTEETKRILSERGKGENNPFYGKKHSKETIEYLRKLSTGKKQSKETKLKMSLSRIGEKNHFYGKKHNEKTKKILSETRKKYVGVKHPRAKPVLCIETGIIYPYIRKAQMETSISESHISSCCNGKLKTAGGYHWKYAKECEENA